MTILITKALTSAYVMTDEPAVAVEMIERHAKALRVKMWALALRRHTTVFATAEMSDSEKVRLEELFGSLPVEVTQIELLKGPGGDWIADAMLKASEAVEVEAVEV